MPSDLARLERWRARPLLNWQRAMICGLLLAGVGFTKCCQIARCHVKSAQAVVPQDWHHMNRWGTARQMRHVRHLGGRQGGTAWVGERLEAARLAYADRSLPLKVTAHRLGAHPDSLRELAVRHGWPPRRPGRASPARRLALPTADQQASP